MAREANPIDFWLGVALVEIYINHIPGIYYNKFTHAAYSVSDSADLFVFLAGWALRLLIGSGEKRVVFWRLTSHLWGRAVTLYAAQMVITMIAIAMLAAVAIVRENPLVLEWHNAAAVFHDPVPTHIGLALVTHQLGFFDILPLFIVLMAIAPGFVLIDRYAPALLLPLSLLVYCTTLGYQIAVPTWPVEGEWFFNPLAWQLVFVLGFVLAREDGIGGLMRRYIKPIRMVAAPIVIASVFIARYEWWFDPTSVPSPKLFFLLSKTYVTPARVIQLLALVAVMSATYPLIQRTSRRLVNFLSMLGRNSLYVFCVGSLLSLAGQIVRYFYRGDLVSDTAVVVLGVLILAVTACLPDWRERSKSRLSSKFLSSS